MPKVQQSHVNTCVCSSFLGGNFHCKQMSESVIFGSNAARLQTFNFALESLCVVGQFQTANEVNQP